jgi:hypothetical protein
VASTPPPQGPDEESAGAEPEGGEPDGREGAPGGQGSPWVAPGAPAGPGAPPGREAPDADPPWRQPPPPPGWQAPPGGQAPPPPGWQGTPGWGAPGWGAPGYQPPVQLPKAGSARTGPLPLHPMTLGDLLDGAFRLLKANLATIVLISAAFFVPLELFSAFLTRGFLGGHGILDLVNDPSLLDQEANAGLSTPQAIGTGLASLISLVVTPLVGGAITKVVAASYLGETLPAGAAIRTTGRRLWALLGATICVHLAELGGLLLCVVGVLVPMTFFVCTTPALIIEGLGPIRAMRRAASLVRPRFWPVLGVVVVSTILTWLLTYILGLPFTAAGELIGLRWGFILIAIGSILPALVASPFVSIVATLIYFDGRIRHEGFDLQVIARDLGNGAAAG